MKDCKILHDINTMPKNRKYRVIGHIPSECAEPVHSPDWIVKDRDDVNDFDRIADVSAVVREETERNQHTHAIIFVYNNNGECLYPTEHATAKDNELLELLKDLGI